VLGARRAGALAIAIGRYANLGVVVVAVAAGRNAVVIVVRHRLDAGAVAA